MGNNLYNSKNINQLKNYLKAGLGMNFLLSVLATGHTKNDLELIRIAMHNKQKKKLSKKYRGVINRDCQKMTNQIDGPKQPIWICWFQGLDNSPQIVKRCFESVRKNTDRHIIMITNKNYMQYTNLPTYILEKYNQGFINRTHFSDILRADLLASYGGTWIDATVLMTNKFPIDLEQVELFFFQKCKPGKSGSSVFISSWFIHAVPNNPIILKTRELLLSYWKTKNKLIDYYLFHIFFSISCDKYEKEYQAVTKAENSSPHFLQSMLDERFNGEQYKNILCQTTVHKLTYKVSKSVQYDKNNFFNFILKS